MDWFKKKPGQPARTSPSNQAEEAAMRQRELELCARQLGVAPNSAEARMERSEALRVLGDEAIKEGNVTAAEGVYELALAELEGVVADFPDNVAAAEMLQSDLGLFGRAASEHGDTALALKRFRASLRLAERLAKPKPNDAEAQKNVWILMMQLATMPGSGMEWGQVMVRMKTAQINGALAPEDEDTLRVVISLDAQAASRE